MGEVLEHLGAGVAWDGDTVTIDAATLTSVEAPYELVRRMRASTAVLGSLLARYGQARVAMPGGDKIGSRPIDLHIAGLRADGCRDRVRARLPRGAAPTGCAARSITLDYPSVGATENLMMAAVARAGRRSSTTPRVSPRSPTSPRSSCRWARGSTAPGTSTIEIDGVDGLRRPLSTSRSPTASRPGPGRPRRWRPAATSRLRAPAPITSTCSCPSSATPVPWSNTRRVACGSGSRAAARDRLRHAALPGRRDRLPADPDGDARDGRRDQHRHGERLREPVPVRGRAAAHGGRHPHRGPPCRDPRHAPAVGRAGASARHPGRCRHGDRGARRRRGHRDRRLHHVDRGYEDFEAKLTGVGADVRRISEPAPTLG